MRFTTMLVSGCAFVALAAGIFLHHMKYGRYIYAVGGNELAARVSGLNVAGIKLLAYTACGAAALAA